MSAVPRGRGRREAPACPPCCRAPRAVLRFGGGSSCPPPPPVTQVRVTLHPQPAAPTAATRGVGPAVGVSPPRPLAPRPPAALASLRRGRWHPGVPGHPQPCGAALGQRGAAAPLPGCPHTGFPPTRGAPWRGWCWPGCGRSRPARFWGGCRSLRVGLACGTGSAPWGTSDLPAAVRGWAPLSAPQGPPNHRAPFPIRRQWGASQRLPAPASPAPLSPASVSPPRGTGDRSQPHGTAQEGTRSSLGSN